MLTLTLAFVNPGAIEQPTPTGRRIAVLHEFDGLIFSGYGDWAANTGPITIYAFDPVGGLLWSEYSMKTEQIAVFRTFGDRLYAAAIDPGGGGYEAMAWREKGSTAWHTIDNVGFDHVFDLQSRGGSEVWAIGSLGTDAIVRYSPDGGETWDSGRALDVSPPRQSSGFARFYFGGILNDELFVQADTSKKGNVFRAGQWQPAPTILSTDSFGSRCVEFQGRLVYLSTYPAAGYSSVWSFNGRQLRELKGVPWAADLQIVGDSLYALTTSGVGVTDDLKTWTYQTLNGLESGEEARCFRVVGGKVYVGTTHSRVYWGNL